MFIKRVLLILMACLMLLGCSEAKDAANDNSQQSNVEGSGDTDISLIYLFRVRKVYAVLPDGRVYGAKRTGFI